MWSKTELWKCAFVTLLAIVVVSSFIQLASRRKRENRIVTDYRERLKVGDKVYYSPSYRGLSGRKYRTDLKYEIVKVDGKTVEIKIEVPISQIYPHP